MSKKKHELIEMPVSYGENYTELVHEGEGIKIDKGVISASGGSGGGGVMICNFNPGAETITLDKTWQELHDALNSGILVIARQKTMEEGEIIYGNYYFCNFTYANLTTYIVQFGGNHSFETTSPNGYPIYVK